MKKFLTASIILCAVTLGIAQTRQLTGKILDSKTNAPMPFANVYVNNTTISTTTDAQGNFILRGIPMEPVDVLFSFVGYEAYRMKLAEGIPKPVSIKLVPGAAVLNEVGVIAKKDKGWEKQLRKFEKIFLGEGPNASACKILNPWDIEFTGDNDFSASCERPIEIENKGLGYRLYYQLKTFAASNGGYSIIGNTRYEEMDPKDEKEAAKWKKNREIALLGSTRHLMKSIMDHTVAKEGFVIYREKENGKIRGYNFHHELETNLLPYDTTGIVVADPGTPYYKILLKDNIEVHYLPEFSRLSFYRDITHPVSFMTVKGSYVRVKKDGTILNSADITIGGAMGQTRISDILPLDYKRGNIIQVQTTKVLTAKRLQEKVYVQTDKPYYYPGEEVWLSAFMNYRAPGMMDTLSRVLYVDLLSQKNVVIGSLTLPIDSGRAGGTITIPVKASPGAYTLRAYTTWMKNYGIENFFYQTIPVLGLKYAVTAPSAEVLISPAPVKIDFNLPRYHAGDSICMSIGLPDEDSTARATLAVSVIDETLVVPVKTTTSIVSEFYYPDDLPPEMLPKFEYPIEKTLGFKGTFYNPKDKPEKTKLMIAQEGLANIAEVVTDDNGVFALQGLAFYDSAWFAIQGRRGRVSVNKKEPLPEPVGIPPTDFQIKETGTLQRPLPTDTAKIMLTTVDVTAKRPSKTSLLSSDYYIPPETLESYPNIGSVISAKLTLFQMSFQDGHAYLIYNRGTSTGEPALYINNNQIIVSSGETVGDRVNMLDIKTIDHIEANSSGAAGLGYNSNFGALYIYTKTADQFATDSKSLPLFRVKGFDKTKPFTKAAHKSFESWSTLYWNPRVELKSAHASAKLSFPSGAAGRYRVIAEGIDQKGIPFRKEVRIFVD